jgi:hypothetical protein
MKREHFSNTGSIMARIEFKRKMSQKSRALLQQDYLGVSIFECELRTLRTVTRLQGVTSIVFHPSETAEDFPFRVQNFGLSFYVIVRSAVRCFRFEIIAASPPQKGKRDLMSLREDFRKA